MAFLFSRQPNPLDLLDDEIRHLQGKLDALEKSLVKELTQAKGLKRECERAQAAAKKSHSSMVCLCELRREDLAAAVQARYALEIEEAHASEEKVKEQQAVVKKLSEERIKLEAALMILKKKRALRAKQR
jgi:phage shock protein A